MCSIYTRTLFSQIEALARRLHTKGYSVDNRLILENLKALSADGGKINLRLPLIHGVNGTGSGPLSAERFPEYM